MLVLLIAICILSGAHAAHLERVHDEELLNLMKVEKYVIVLFTTNDCEDCNTYERKLAHLREDLVDAMSAWVVKTVDSQLLQLYSNAREPVLLFFRHGIPLLYDGPLEDEDIINTFTDNKAPTVKELTDDTFEHLTQASSGATTGDWFVMFYSTDCVQCLRMMAKWETVGAKLKHRLNVALVNKATTGVSTARRFNVYNTPQFMLFRHGKMYRYDSTTYDIASLIAFAKEWYKDIRPEEVPPLPSFFDEYTKIILNFLYENPWILKLTSICIGVLVIVLAAIKCMQSDETPEEKED
ncbi:uncharacterized protein LOC112456874 [Temnothorax curvispinosus]|uniref:Uncharacterized protein LOC112456874 n=2 Tax=Temnothorax TaxID=300110 RepID=A0A6J1PZY7_9HYME|nr:uncharacterized protein LOC112456874 [Temnothorax curvispinosus]TGZ46521.1 Uncharacterized protein DBV15_09917 [Temnothorax longispinosus]